MSVRILYLSRTSPLPATGGAPVRVDSIWQTLKGLFGTDVSLAVLGDKPKPDVRQVLRAQGVKFFPPRRETPLDKIRRYVSAYSSGRCIVATRFLSERRIRRVVRYVQQLSPDVVILGDTELAELISPIKSATGAKVICDTHNVWSLLHERVAKQSRTLSGRVQHKLLRKNMLGIEQRLLKLADVVWATSDTDAGHYREVLKLPRVHTVPNVIDVDRYEPHPGGEAGAIVFTGFMRYWPNEDAALRLVGISKRLASENIPHHVYLVGKAPTDTLKSAAKGVSSVTVTGFVPDVQVYLNKASVVAVPLMSGSGTKIKILEALASAKAVLTTPIGAEGMTVSEAAVIVGDEDAFYTELKSMLNDPARCERIGLAGREWVEQYGSRQALARRIAVAMPVEVREKMLT
jgi:glycosyltransferase involved in cell wall biosynthesis